MDSKSRIPKEQAGTLAALNRAIFVREGAEAARLYGELVTAQPDFILRGPAQFDLARLLETTGHNELALVALKAIIDRQKESPTRGPAMRSAGKVAYALKRFDEAVDYLQQFLETKPLTPDRQEAEEILSRLPPDALERHRKKAAGAGVRVDEIPSSWNSMEGGKPITFEWKVPTPGGKKPSKEVKKPVFGDELDIVLHQQKEPKQESISLGDLCPPTQGLPPMVQAPPVFAPTHGRGPQQQPPMPPQYAQPVPQPYSPPGYPQNVPPSYYPTPLPNQGYGPAPGFGPPPGYPAPPAAPPYQYAPPPQYAPPYPQQQQQAYGYQQQSYPPIAPPTAPLGNPRPPDAMPATEDVRITSEAIPLPPARDSFEDIPRRTSMGPGDTLGMAPPASTDEAVEVRYDRLREGLFALLLPLGKRIHLEAVAELISKIEGIDESQAKKFVLKRKGMLYDELTLASLLELIPIVKKCRQSLVFVNVPRDLKPYEHYDVLGAEVREQGLKMTTDSSVRRIRWSDIRLVNCGVVGEETVATIVGCEPMKEYRFASGSFNPHTMMHASSGNFQKDIIPFLKEIVAHAPKALKSHTVENVLNGKTPTPQTFTAADEFAFYSSWVLYSHYGEMIDADELVEMGRVSSNW
ncbi:hypothetical protein BH09SUM1_BH09SUM1_12740 [soil metagenome]